MILDPILDNAPCGFVTVSDDGTMVAVNNTLAKTLGYERAALEGWHIQKILSPGGRLFYNTHVFPLLKMHGLAEEVYLPLRTSDGDDLPMLVNARRREGEAAEVSDFVFVRMLQRHRFEEELLEARREAETASEAKSKFLSMMSHDLRTPLTTISGHAELIHSGFHGAVNDGQRDSALAISSAARDVGRLIDDILAYAQVDSGKVPIRSQPVAIRELVERAETLLRLRMTAAGITFDAATCSDDVVVQADPGRLQQILLNLLTNALKFTPEGGRISVSCEQAPGRVILRVSDSGIGIPVEQRERIFEPFVQLAFAEQPGTEGSGVGLGLAISRDLARAMGGELTAEGATDGGSVFRLELPAVGAAQPV